MGEVFFSFFHHLELDFIDWAAQVPENIHLPPDFSFQ